MPIQVPFKPLSNPVRIAPIGPVACELSWVVGLVGYGSSQEVFFKGRISGCFNADVSLPGAGLSSHLEVGGVWYSPMPLGNLRRGNKAAA